MGASSSKKIKKDKKSENNVTIIKYVPLNKFEFIDVVTNGGLKEEISELKRTDDSLANKNDIANKISTNDGNHEDGSVENKVTGVNREDDPKDVSGKVK